MKADHVDARVTNPGIIKIIGIGQSLRGDDAVGLQAVHLWQETYHTELRYANVKVDLIELPGISLLDLLEGAEVAIIVDAVRSESAPGTLHQVTEGELSAFTGGSGSAHGWGVAETIQLGRQIMPSSMPQKIILIGIEAGQFNLGGTLSPDVQAALPEVVRLIEQCVVQAMSSTKN